MGCGTTKPRPVDSSLPQDGGTKTPGVGVPVHVGVVRTVSLIEHAEPLYSGLESPTAKEYIDKGGPYAVALLALDELHPKLNEPIEMRQCKLFEACIFLASQANKQNPNKENADLVIKPAIEAYSKMVSQTSTGESFDLCTRLGKSVDALCTLSLSSAYYFAASGFHTGCQKIAASLSADQQALSADPKKAEALCWMLRALERLTSVRDLMGFYLDNKVVELGRGLGKGSETVTAREGIRLLAKLFQLDSAFSGAYYRSFASGWEGDVEMFLEAMERFPEDKNVQVVACQCLSASASSHQEVLECMTDATRRQRYMDLREKALAAHGAEGGLWWRAAVNVLKSLLELADRAAEDERIARETKSKRKIEGIHQGYPVKLDPSHPSFKELQDADAEGAGEEGS
uniref:Uncharacterized protein n=1 Tax=Chromera velia CCMP2878 TaxID=1169474 RepID=A0A0G4FGQ8_9ALVE|eukprot:Cvel_16892.t1-p1 / transcript=Cvel_16892.t1 / gene=Cvel_16892 / organism=Chromera_velia_CCMP2878 / gene_product=hypothetical protein / transcript_product=hypothetical protein / location=Cvel_scaffold1322:26541-28442(-) / protein_length=400 / sequence_SO=supercontig / SO=protein_coding / is_pseudo=false